MNILKNQEINYKEIVVTGAEMTAMIGNPIDFLPLPEPNVYYLIEKMVMEYTPGTVPPSELVAYEGGFGLCLVDSDDTNLSEIINETIIANIGEQNIYSKHFNMPSFAGAKVTLLNEGDYEYVSGVNGTFLFKIWYSINLLGEYTDVQFLTADIEE